MGLTVGEQDVVAIGGGELGVIQPIEIDNKKVYLPTDEFLNGKDLKDSIAFHPLAEDILKKRSPMLTAIQNAFHWRLYTASVFLIEAVISACIKQRKGENITDPRMLRYLSSNEECDEKIMQFFRKLTEVVQADSSKKIFNVYLRHSSDNEGSLRQCSITSPLLAELERVAAIGSTRPGGLDVWGVQSPRKKDVMILANLIKSIFPGIEDKTYSTASSNKIAPYCDALFRALLLINEDINKAAIALATISPVKEAVEYLCVDLAAVELMLDKSDEWDIYRNSIIKTAYNDGDGWEREVRNPNATETKSEPRRVVAENVDKRVKEEDPVAITKAVINKSIRPIPGTRQPLITNITEDDYRTVKRSRPEEDERNRSYYGNRREERRDDSRGSSRRSISYTSINPRPSQYRTRREVEDDIYKLEDLRRDIRLDGDRRSLEDLDYDLETLDKILADFDYESRRDSRGYHGGERYRSGRGNERDSGRGFRHPREADYENRSRSSRGEGQDRFGRDSRRR